MVLARVPVSQVIPLRWQVLRAGRPIADAHWPGDLDAQHFLLRQGGHALAIASVFTSPWPDAPLGPRLQLRGMAVSPDRQGQGLGARLLRFVRWSCSAPLWCNARVGAAGFYTGQGWRPASPDFDLPGIGPHRRMISGQ